MKKEFNVLAFFLSAVMLIGLVSCNSSTESPTTSLKAFQESNQVSSVTETADADAVNAADFIEANTAVITAPGAVTLQKMELKRGPFKTVFEQNDLLDVDGTWIVLTYSDGSEKNCYYIDEMNGFTVEGDTAKIGSGQTVTVKRKEDGVVYKVSFPIDVVEGDWSNAKVLKITKIKNVGDQILYIAKGVNDSRNGNEDVFEGTGYYFSGTEDSIEFANYVENGKYVCDYCSKNKGMIDLNVTESKASFASCYVKFVGSSGEIERYRLDCAEGATYTAL